MSTNGPFVSNANAKKIALDEFPEAIQKQIKVFHESLVQLKGNLQPLVENFEELEEKAATSLEKAQLNYTAAYALNSLFWMYLITTGENPQEHEIKREIDRLKAAGVRIKEVADRDKKKDNNSSSSANTQVATSSSRVDPNAAKRFVRNALWEPSNNVGHGVSNKRTKFV